jgi:hypothetical protein
MDQENPLAALPEKAVPAYQARKILNTRPDISPAATAAFMFGNETLAGLLYGKLYQGFKKFQAAYGLSDHACDYFGDHASEDAEADGPAFEASHANLMLNAVFLYAGLGPRAREQTVKGLHLFLETYNAFVESLCPVVDQDDQRRGGGAPSVRQERQAVELCANAGGQPQMSPTLLEGQTARALASLTIGLAGLFSPMILPLIAALSASSAGR